MAQTLAQLATFVSNKMSQNDSVSISQIKEFIKNRYKMIWEECIWKESKQYYSQTVSIGATDISLNSNLELITDVIWYNTPLFNIEPEILFRARPNWQTLSGKPIYYINRPKSSGNCVIRFDVMPDTQQTVYYCGKLVFTPLVNDTDTPLLSGIDNCLLSFAEADCLEYIRQFGTAQTKLQEAISMFNKMLDIERNQTTKILQIQPVINDWSLPKLVPTTQSILVNTDFLRG